ncbi:MAG TPA: MFS transporter [Chitinophagaceae bacterium]|nr:MFS transporter [Chitinophagaceae bacterium]
MSTISTGEQAPLHKAVEKTVFPVLFAISFSHLLNDTIQSIIPAIYPLLKTSFQLSYTQIGLITFTFQLAASLLQPFVGSFTDRKPQPFSLATGMSFTLIGLLLLSWVGSYHLVLLSVALIGIGSSIFHPEASRVAYMASGGRRGLAQSIFQLGGNFGSSLGPLLAALVIVPFGRISVSWFSVLALVAIGVLYKIGQWYQKHHTGGKKAKHVIIERQPLSKTRVTVSVIILLLLIFSKYFYIASISSYFTFYLIEKFHLSVQSAQFHLFLFLAAVAAGTILGGPLGDRFGRKYVIWASILGVAPFTLFLPYAGPAGTTVLIIIIGVILASAFSAILVYAQELLPKKLGLVSGLFFGFAFGMGGIGSALLGRLADHTSIEHVYKACSFLPLIGLLTGFLPNIETRRKQKA